MQMGAVPPDFDVVAASTTLGVLSLLMPLAFRDTRIKRSTRDLAVEHAQKARLKLLQGKVESEAFRDAQVKAIEAQKNYEESRQMPMSSYIFEYANTQLLPPELTREEQVERLLGNYVEFEDFVEARHVKDEFRPATQEETLRAKVVVFTCFAILAFAILLSILVVVEGISS
jgi:hypothetical protein